MRFVRASDLEIIELEFQTENVYFQMVSRSFLLLEHKKSAQFSLVISCCIKYFQIQSTELYYTLQT